MGQYFIIVNLDKKEYLHPHKLNSGAKLWEICMSIDCVGILPYLLRKSSGYGGGDISAVGNPDESCPNAGRWAEDRIAVVGDYDGSNLYNKAQAEYEDISDIVKVEWRYFRTH